MQVQSPPVKATDNKISKGNFKEAFVIITMINNIHDLSMPAENCTGSGRIIHYNTLRYNAIV